MLLFMQSNQYFENFCRIQERIKKWTNLNELTDTVDLERSLIGNIDIGNGNTGISRDFRSRVQRQS